MESKQNNSDIQRLSEMLEIAKAESTDGHSRIDRYRRYYRDNVKENSTPKRLGENRLSPTIEVER